MAQKKKEMGDSTQGEKIAVFLSLLCFFLVGFLLLCYLSFDALSSSPNLNKWVHEIYGVKEQAALSKQSPKIILVGGSNVVFGVSARTMEERLGIPTVNFGADAGLREYLFEKAKQVAGEGDIIILAPEYEFYRYDYKKPFSAQTRKERYILTYDRDYFDSLPFSERFSMQAIGAVDLYRNYASRTKNASEFYTKDTLNAWGDETNNSYAMRDIPHLKKFKPMEFPRGFAADIHSHDGPKYLIEFAQWCDDNKVTCIVSYPSILSFEEYSNQAAQQYQDFSAIESFLHEHGILTLGSPADFFYPIDMMYDGHYHLNDRGTKVRTDFIIRELRTILAEKRPDLILKEQRKQPASVNT